MRKQLKRWLRRTAPVKGCENLVGLKLSSTSSFSGGVRRQTTIEAMVLISRLNGSIYILFISGTIKRGTNAATTPLDMKNTKLSNGVNHTPISCFAIRSPQGVLRQMPYGKSNGGQLNHTVYCAGGYSRISSKYIVPEPPVCGLFLLPRPRAIVLTLARFTSWSANA